MLRRCKRAEIQWDSIFRFVLSNPPHREFEVAKAVVPHPLDIGLDLASGYPQGALAQYSIAISEGGRIHIREYPAYYTVHWDTGNPDSGLGGLITHVIHDAPEVMIWLALAGVIIAEQRKKRAREGKRLEVS